MPDEDLEKLLRLISDAKREAKSRKLETLIYLLGLAELEAAKAKEIPPRPLSEPTKRGPFGHRRGP